MLFRSNATSSRQALCSFVMRAPLNGKKIGPQGLIISGLRGGGGIACTFIVVEQLLPGHGLSHCETSVVTSARTVTGPVIPVVLSVTSVPAVDESLPPVVVQWTDNLPAPSAIAMIRPDEFGKLKLPAGWGNWSDAVEL